MQFYFIEKKTKNLFTRLVWLGVKIPSALTDDDKGHFTKTMGRDNLK